MSVQTDIAFQTEDNRTVLAYWRERAGDRAMPARGDLDPMIDLRDLAQHLFLVDVEREPLRFRFRLVGTEVVAHVGKDMTGKYLDELVEYDRHYEKVKADYVTTASTGEPTVGVVRFLSDDGDICVNYERLILPLSEDGRTVDKLLGACCALGPVEKD